MPHAIDYTVTCTDSEGGATFVVKTHVTSEKKNVTIENMLPYRHYQCKLSKYIRKFNTTQEYDSVISFKTLEDGEYLLYGMCVCMYVCTYVCTYVCMYVRIGRVLYCSEYALCTNIGIFVSIPLCEHTYFYPYACKCMYVQYLCSPVAQLMASFSAKAVVLKCRNTRC